MLGLVLTISGVICGVASVCISIGASRRRDWKRFDLIQEQALRQMKEEKLSKAKRLKEEKLSKAKR